MSTISTDYAAAWLQNHVVQTQKSDGTTITYYLSVKKPVASPDDANVEITAFKWGQGPMRVRGVVDTSGTANLSILLTVPILGTVNIADLGVNIQTPSATANINLVIATGYATVSLDSTDIYLEVHIKSPFGNVDFDRTLIFSI